MSEEVMELEIEEEPEEKEEKEAPEVEGVLPAGGGLTVSLENPEIHIDKLIIKKKE